MSSKSSILVQIEKTLDNIKGDVEISEITDLENKIDKTRRLQEDIDVRINEIKNGLISSYDDRQNFEQNLELITNWASGKESEVASPSLLPLKADAAEKMSQRYKKLESDMTNFMNTTIVSVKRQADSLMKDCDEEDAEVLEETIDEIVDNVSELKQTLSGTLTAILNLVEARKDFEKQVDVAQRWIQQSEATLQTDTRSLNSADVLEEHLKKLEKLEDEQEDANLRVNSIANMCAELLEYLTESDKFTLGETVRSLQDKTELVSTNLTEKIEQIRDAICKVRQMTERMVQSTQTLSNIQKEARGLSRPVGRTVEDGQKLLLSYQSVMRKVSEFRKGLEEMRKCPDVTMEEMRELIKQQQALMSILEKQIQRIRQLILVRQQYASLTSEITAFISRYNTIIKDIENSPMTVADKLKKFNAVIVRIQECEGQLTSAQDKGSIISDEGHVEDRNAIIEQLQTLRTGVANLRREVEKCQQEHETTAESHKKLQIELNTTMEWLFEQESELKSRPLLTLEVDSADEEIETHNELAADIQEQLTVVKKVIDKAKYESGLPYILQERISEANMVVSTYPLELDSRLKYLTDAKMLREDYQEFSTKISDWINDAKSRLSEKDGVDYENIATDLEDHNAFFTSERLIGESLQQLGQTAERIVPSLGSEEQEELSDEIQQLTKDLDEVTQLAKKCKQTTEKNIKGYTDYKASLDKCKALIHSAGSNLSTDDSAPNIAALRSIFQRVDEERNRLYDQNFVIDEFTEKANELLQTSTDSCQKTFGEEMVDMSKKWKAALEKIDTRRVRVQQLIEKWQRFELSVRSLEAGLSALEQRLKDVELLSPTVKNKDEINETLKVRNIVLSFTVFEHIFVIINFQQKKVDHIYNRLLM